MEKRISIEEILGEKISLEDGSKKDINISDILEKINTIQEDVECIDEYKKIVGNIKYDTNINEMLENGYDINYKNMQNIDEAIRGFYWKLIKNKPILGSKENEEERKKEYKKILQYFSFIIEVMKEKNIDKKDLLDDLIILADLNRVNVSSYEGILKRLILKYHDDVIKKLDIKDNISDLEIAFFEARMRTIKDISAEYIKEMDISKGLRSQYMEMCEKHLNNAYGLNVPVPQFTYSYVRENSEEYKKRVGLFENYLKSIPVENMVAYNASKLCKEKQSDMSLKELEKGMEKNGFISKEHLSGTIELEKGDVLFAIKKSMESCDSIEDLIYLKEELIKYMKKGILPENIVFEAIVKYGMAYEMMDVLESIVGSNKDEKLDEEILSFVITKRGNVGVLKALHDKGVNLSKNDEYSKTPLKYACESGNYEAVRFLVDIAKVRINSVHIDREDLDIYLDRDDLDEELFVNGAIIDGKSTEPDTILNCVANGGNIELMKFFISKGLKPNVKSRYGTTPLMVAYKNGDIKMMETLLERRADPNIPNRHKKTILMDAMAKENLEAIELILKHSYANNLGEILLRTYNDIDLDNVLKNCRRFINRYDSNGKTPLMVACEKGKIGLIIKLLENGADINIKDAQDRHTALTYALSNGRIGVVSFLIKHGATVGKEKVLTYAYENGDSELLKILVDNGININEKDKNGETVLMKMCKDDKMTLFYSDNVEQMEELQWRGKRGEVKRLILKNGVNINEKDKMGLTALSHAWLNQDTKMAKILIKKGANISSGDVKGIIKKYEETNKELVKILLETGVKVKKSLKDKELEKIRKDLKELKKACKKNKFEDITKKLQNNDSIGYRRIALTKILKGKLPKDLSKRSKRNNLIEKIFTELVKNDKELVEWAVNTGNAAVVQKLIKEKKIDKDMLDEKNRNNVITLAKYTNNLPMVSMLNRHRLEMQRENNTLNIGNKPLNMIDINIQKW